MTATEYTVLDAGDVDRWDQEADVWEHPLLSRFVPPHVLQPRSVRRKSWSFWW